MFRKGRLIRAAAVISTLTFCSFASANEEFTWFGQRADGHWMAGIKLSSLQNGNAGYDDNAVNTGIVLGYQFARPVAIGGTSSLEFEFSNSIDEGNVTNDAGYGVGGMWEAENLAMYFTYRSEGSVYFIGRFGFLKSDVETSLDNLNTFSEDDTAFSYGAGLGIHLGESGNLNLELELVGASGNNDLNQVTIGGVYLFP